jgi:hypothetical protein
MLLGLEIGMLVSGLVVLLSGRFRLSPQRVAEGTAARLAGLVLLLPWPLSFCLEFLLGVRETIAGRRLNPEEWQQTFLISEVVIVTICGAVALLIGLTASSGGSKSGQQRRLADQQREARTSPPVAGELLFRISAWGKGDDRGPTTESRGVAANLPYLRSGYRDDLRDEDIPVLEVVDQPREDQSVYIIATVLCGLILLGVSVGAGFLFYESWARSRSVRLEDSPLSPVREAPPARQP